MKKQNLILVNAFYTNSILLNGFIEYLEDYFHVYFIDLPGFSRHSPPLDDISFDSFTAYVQKKIEEFDLDSFIMGGISFGFLIANNIELDSRCQGIAAVVPYINKKSLGLTRSKKVFYSLITRIVVRFGMASQVWNSKIFRKFAYWYSVYPSDRVDVIFDHMDPETFFTTGRLILKNREHCDFHDLPTILILSAKDQTVKNDYVKEVFKRNISNLFVVKTDIEHYPLQLDKDYFREKFTGDTMDRIISFLNGDDTPEAP